MYGSSFAVINIPKGTITWQQKTLLPPKSLIYHKTCIMEQDTNKEQDPKEGGEDREATRRTDYFSDDEMDNIIDSDEDYRLPRQFSAEAAEKEAEQTRPAADDPSTDVSERDIAILDDSEASPSSDESRYGTGLLDEEDEEGDPLNEGPDENSLFDTGEDLDMPDSVMDPDETD